MLRTMYTNMIPFGGRAKLLRHLLLLSLLLLFLPSIGANSAPSPDVLHTSGLTSQPERTGSELYRLWDACGTADCCFSVAPSVKSPYSAGALSQEAISCHLDQVNFFRYCAGLTAVGASAWDNLDAQYGAALLASTNTLSHSQTMLPDMPIDFFWHGSNALNSSNIGSLPADSSQSQKDEKALAHCFMLNYMNDRGVCNRATVSHRRWILSPALQTVGIGRANAADGTQYQVLKVANTAWYSFCPADYDFIAWPASGVFPKQAISPKVPWSVTLNPSKFQKPNRSSLHVTVTEKSTNYTWTLNASSSASASDANFLLVDEDEYGGASCIIFAFYTKCCKYQGEYQVTISGLKANWPAKDVILDYTIRFIDVENCAHLWSNWRTVTPATCTSEGSQIRVCADCGAQETRPLAPLGHNWVSDFVIIPATKYDDGLSEYACTRCNQRKTEALPQLQCTGVDCACSRYTDAPKATDWSHSGLDFSLENGLMNGTSPTTLNPNGYMNRAMLVTVLWRMAGKPTPSKDAVFWDVKATDYCASAVNWAVASGIVTGYSAHHFGPWDQLTRAQCVTMFYRYLGGAPSVKAVETISTFPDRCWVESYAADAIGWALENKIICGQTNACGYTFLNPRGFVTRAQVAAILMRTAKTFPASIAHLNP